ncbi:FtsX-like permease family protein [Yeosuana sp. MJ-SS3]|uniref:FtsX-like permease family protein n=1 Tax=Gilvirhabdus luticola TaxID=3079858 RepID=A0ABU3U950_9FLAO|nr:ABC transporter permease [Yeosuana sp. MJ-SS3]MDU8886943.1 FtsX-like permease family protein [Yeosuana sp. MJ-SS3]
MFKNYLKVAFRSLNKNRIYAVINILGLALGLTVSILVYLFVQYETSYDKHWAEYDRIYRTGLNAALMGQKINAPISAHPMAQTLRTEFPNVETATRVNVGRQEVLMRHEQTKLYIQNFASVDSTFFKIFDYEFVHGDPITALKENNAIVLTQETANKFFGDNNAMGQIVNLDEREDYIVKGIVKESKGPAHFKFEMFLSDNEVRNNWVGYNWYTYLKLNEGVNVTTFKKEMDINILKKIEPEIERILQTTWSDFIENENNAFELQLQPLKDIHLHSHLDQEIRENGNITYIYVFIGIALLVILIAGINFMNLSTARSGNRAKEVGVRKVSGASRKMLIFQFLTESIIQSLIALFLAFILVELFLPGFNNIMQSELTLFDSNINKTILLALIVTLLYGIFAGSYPAFYLSNFRPIAVLKGDFTKTKSGALLRKGLVVIQFTASTILIIGMIIIFKQLSYLQNKDIGFKGDQVMIVPIQTSTMLENFRNYKDIFYKNKNIQSISRADHYPGGGSDVESYILEGSDEQFLIREIHVDYDFFKTLGIQLLEGRVFDQKKDSDSLNYYILNESAVKELNIENPIGKRIAESYDASEGANYGTVIGVVKDFHIQGFNQPIRPMVIGISNYTHLVSFKITPNDMNATIDFIEKEWGKLEPSHPFRYSFLDQNFGALLRQQENFGTMFLFLTILAIIISAMGLYGLSSYTAEQRTKEIGIRKVLGATVSSIMAMLTKDFIKLVLIANIFAWPITYLLAKDWLSNFSYQIDMPILPYLLATFLALIIALITVSSQAYIAANSDPVNSLKYE